MRPGALLAMVLVLGCSGGAAAEETRLWRAADSDEFRQGFVAGIASYLMDFPDGVAIRAGYADCFAGQTGASLLKVVDDYIDRNPQAASYASDVTITMAFKESCAGFMPQPPVMP
jgi:hypothetical protein